MPRFYVSPESWNLDQPALGPGESHHALDVLRMKTGERATIFNGKGAEATVEITGIEKHRIGLRTILKAKTAPLSCRITLAQAIPKGKNMELIIEKATELGAAAVIPLLSDRTVVVLDEEDAVKKQEKWQTVAIEACKQCGQNWLPEVQHPRSLKEFFNANPRYDMMLIASLQPGAQHFKSILAAHIADHSSKPESVLILVGPEGDFTPAEISLAIGSGCRPVTLGPIVLRTETAAIYCLGMLGYELLSA